MKKALDNLKNKGEIDFIKSADRGNSGEYLVFNLKTKTLRTVFKHSGKWRDDIFYPKLKVMRHEIQRLEVVGDYKAANKLLKMLGFIEKYSLYRY